jgi:hypothetical protein
MTLAILLGAFDRKNDPSRNIWILDKAKNTEKWISYSFLNKGAFGARGGKAPLSGCINAPRAEGAPRAVGIVHNVAQDFSQKGFSKLLLKCFGII